MAYNFIYTINGRTSSSDMYETRDECYVGQSKFINSKEIVGSVNNVQVQSCNDYSNEGAFTTEIYNFNTNASQYTTKKLDLIPDVVKYTMLEPINGNDKIDVTENGFSNYIQSSFNVILGVIIVIGVFRIMYGGTIFLTTDIVMGKMKGKETIINSLRGILLAMVTWSLLYFINPDILSNNVTKVVSEGSTNIVKEVGKIIGVVPPVSIGNSDLIAGPELLAKILADESRVRNKFASGGIDINRSACTVVGSFGCTDVGLINDNIINKIISLETECKVLKSSCEVTITGGTEWWAHGGGVRNPNINKSKHVPGKFDQQGIDLALTDTLITFLKTAGSSLGSDKYCYVKYQYNGAVYCDEINTNRHFHVNY